MACAMCENALIEWTFSDAEDFCMHCFGEFDRDYQMFYRSVVGEPLCMVVEKYNGDDWDVVGIYYPSYCPCCGRKLENPTEEQSGKNRGKI